MRRVVAGPVWLVAGVHALGLLALAGRYGFHRDELYFLEAGRHLALGFVDQPPLVPALARLQTEVLGSTVAAVRVVPALVSATSVVLAALLARELGGGRRAQVLAAGAVAGAGFVLATGHLLSTATLDFAFWLALLVVATRMLRTGDARLWVVYGGAAGVALWNKHLVVLLTVALLVALAAERRRDLLAPRWLALGGLLALVVASPTLLWQAVHGWPQLQMAGSLADRLGTENRITLLPLQLVMLGPVLLPVGWAGVRWLTAPDGPGRAFRPLLWTYVAALALTFLAGGRPYYPLPVAATLLVAGTVAVGDRRTSRAPALVVVNAAIAIPLGLPVVPVAALADSPATVVNDTLVEQVGWPQLARTVADVVAELPPGEGVVLLTGSYGEAGALDRYGPGLGLPEVYSGHNGYWHWRRPSDDDATVVAVRMGADDLAQHFATCDRAAVVDNRLGVDNEVQGAPVWVCRGLRGGWAQVWPDLRHYD